LPKFSTITRQGLILSGVRRLALLSLTLACFLLVTGISPGQSKPATELNSLKSILPPRLDDHWKATSEARLMSAEQYSVLPVGEVFTEYGMFAVSSRDYTDGKTRLTVEVFQMNFTSSAYGLHLFNRGQLAPNRREFFQNQYLVSLSTDPPTATPDPALEPVLRQLLPQADSGQPPPLPLHLPDADKIAGTEKYYVGPLGLARISPFEELKDVVNFTGGAEATSARYRNGSGEMSLLIVEYPTPQLAADAYAKFQTYFDALPQEAKEKRLLTKTGNYVIELFNVADRASAETFVKQIKYSPKVYWEGKQITDIPLVFRPPDPTAVEEAFQTANVLIRTFYWIGVMLTSALVLGVVVGSTLFYWKRYLRRKRGLDDLFSEDGETVRLNLDDYLLAPTNEPVKKIGKGIEEK
jgi:hypothetical protein